MRDLLPLDELIRQITMPGLPMQLRANYLCVLREAYLETERANKEVGAYPALMGYPSPSPSPSPLTLSLNLSLARWAHTRR